MLSNYLKQYFKERKITHKEIEEKTGVSRTKITQSLNGNRKFTAEELILMGIVFEIDLNKLKELDNL